MKRLSEKELKRKRKEYIRQRLEGVQHKGTEVRRLSRELFLSMATIYRDLRK